MQQWEVAVAVYGGGLQGEKTSNFFFVPNELKSVKKQHVFFVFYVIVGWVGGSEAIV